MLYLQINTFILQHGQRSKESSHFHPFKNQPIHFQHINRYLL